MIVPEPSRIAKFVADVLDEFGIPYFVGGSLASSLHGIPRTTQDVDIIADIKPIHIENLVKALEERFYIDREMVRDAIERHASFNVIDLETVFKVDIFISGPDRASRNEMERRQRRRLSAETEDTIFLASAEDIILNKLRWFRLGGKVSERQWLDVLGVLQVQRKNLDFKYLQEAAIELGIKDLLDEAVSSTGLNADDERMIDCWSENP